MKVVDTTFLVDLLRGNKEALKLLNRNTEFLTTKINMYEVITGLFYEDVSRNKFQLAQELFESIRVLPLDDGGVIRAAKINADLIKSGKIIEDTDCLIAGISLSKGFDTIITKNTKHFSRIKGLKVETY